MKSLSLKYAAEVLNKLLQILSSSKYNFKIFKLPKQYTKDFTFSDFSFSDCSDCTNITSTNITSTNIKVSDYGTVISTPELTPYAIDYLVRKLFRFAFKRELMKQLYCQTKCNRNIIVYKDIVCNEFTNNLNMTSYQFTLSIGFSFDSKIFSRCKSCKNRLVCIMCGINPNDEVIHKTTCPIVHIL